MSNLLSHHTVCTIFKPISYKLYLSTVFIGSDALEYVSDTKYLGFSICDSKRDNNDMLLQMKSLYAKSNKLLSTFSHCNDCSTNVNFTLIQSCCTTSYCKFLWNSSKQSTFNKIRVTYNNVYRKIYDRHKKSSACAMYVRYNICSFESMLRKRRLIAYLSVPMDLTICLILD